MKGPTLQKFYGTIRKLFAGVIAIMILDGRVTARAWEPAYKDEQLDVINGQLEKWKGDDTYSKVADIFHDKSYEPDWKSAKADAEPWDLMPDSFPDEQAARKAGGQCDYIKDMKKKSCLFEFSYLQGAGIFVYDLDATGKFVKSSVIVPPTWYGIASVEFVDAFGPSRPKFVLIEHQGDHGTGVNEKIQWMLGWHNGGFHTVFRETVYLSINGLGEKTDYRLKYKFVKGKNPRIETQSRYDLVAVTAEPYDFHTQWRDWLFWNERDFSFYQGNIQKENADFHTSYGNQFKFRQEVEKKRLQVLKFPPLPKRGDADHTLDKYWEQIDSVN
jgi:hypothetical protein